MKHSDTYRLMWQTLRKEECGAGELELGYIAV